MTYDDISNQMWTYGTGSDSHDNIMSKSAQLCSTSGELCYSMILYVPTEITSPDISELLWT